MDLKYDFIVIGGGTAGCAAAYTAGISGYKTLLLEKKIHLGGTITSGLVIPVMKSGENQINTEFYNALTAELKSVGGQITYQNNQGWFNPELCKCALDSLMQKANVDVLFNAHIQDVIIDNRLIKKIIISKEILSVYNDKLQNEKKELSVNIEARYVIDTTGNCEIGKLCNCEFLEEKYQPQSLRFIMGGVDTDAFGKWISALDSDRDVTTVERIDGVTHLSTACTWDKEWALKPLFDKAVRDGILKDEDRNYFQVFTIAGMPSCIAFNCPRIISNSGSLDIFETSKGLTEARKSIFRLANFCKKYLKGFENAYISNIADELGIRVSGRIKGRYVYTIDDLKSGKTFENPVLISNYPVDVHSSDKNASELQKVRDYQLPAESLISADIDNLFIAGRCISADFLSQAALRVQASCFSMGEGIVKYIKKRGI